MNTLMPLFEASLRGALLIGCLVLLRAPLRRLIGSPWLCALWLVVLVRLLLPGSIQSSWSVFNWWPQTKIAQAGVLPIEARVTVLPAAGIADTPELVAPAAVAVAKATAKKGDWLIFIWAIGAGVTMAILGWRILKTARMARSTQPADDARLLEAFDSIPPELRKNVVLRQVTELEVPALVGLWRPQIWMPASWLETMSVEELRHVLLHELGHARRGDLWVQWLFAFAQCVHWFNPAVWLAARLAHADRELACDAWVLRRTNLHEQEQYGATLVKAAQLLRSRWHLPPAAITMAMSKASLFSRVRSIGQFQPVAGWRAVLGSIGVGLLLGSLATDRLHAQSGGLAPSVAPAAGPAPAAGAPPFTTPPAAGSAPGYGGAGTGNFGIAPTPVQTAPVAMNPHGGAGLAGAPAPSPYQVEVQARFFEMSDAGWKTLGLDGLSTGDEYGTLHTTSILDPSGLHTILARINAAGAGGGQATGTGSISSAKTLLGPAQPFLLAAPRVTTKSGQRAVIEIIREFRYATTFQADPKHPDGMVPTAFETRNVGITLEVEPTVGPDGSTVDLGLVPQIVELTGFVRVRDGQPIPLPVDPTKKGLDRILHTPLPKDVGVQPIFSARKITTLVTLHSGHTIVMGGLKQAGENDAQEAPQALLILITARVLPNAVATPMVVPGLEAIPGSAGIFDAGGTGSISAPVAPVPAAPPQAMPGAPGAGRSGIPGAVPPLQPVPARPGALAPPAPVPLSPVRR